MSMTKMVQIRDVPVLAKLLDAPLLTSDARIAGAAGHSATLELI